MLKLETNSGMAMALAICIGFNKADPVQTLVYCLEYLTRAGALTASKHLTIVLLESQGYFRWVGHDDRKNVCFHYSLFIIIIYKPRSHNF